MSAKAGLGKIGVTPLAFESLGVRSMATFVETPDVRILIDPGVALGPRFGQLPHPLEYEALQEARGAIRGAASKADILTISHYHHDHHTPNFVDTVWLFSGPEEFEAIYTDKVVYARDIRQQINFSQRRRGWIFGRVAKKYVKELRIADGAAAEFGATKLRFSQPVYHGESESGLGWVVMTTVERDDIKVMHTADVQGPMSDDTLRLILAEDPQLLVIGGPPLYLTGFKVAQSSFDAGIKNLAEIARRVPSMIVDHHLLRSEGWRAEASPILATAEQAGHRLRSAAEYLGREERLLESQRQELYKRYPPGHEFSKWLRLSQEKRKKAMPPLVS